MNQFNMSNMEIEEFCEALVLDYIRKYNAPTDYIDIRGLITDYISLNAVRSIDRYGRTTVSCAILCIQSSIYLSLSSSSLIALLNIAPQLNTLAV